MRRWFLVHVVCPWPWWKDSRASGAICRVRRGKTFARCYFLDTGEILTLGLTPIMLRVARRLHRLGFRTKWKADLTPAFREAAKHREVS